MGDDGVHYAVHRQSH